jgi:hypothetical protein
MPIRVVAIIALWLSWFGFANAISAGEAIAATAAAALTLGVQVAVRKRADVPSGSKLRWFGQAAIAWPRRIAHDLVDVLGAAVARHPRAGAFRRVRYEAPAIEIAWCVTGTSISPNAYVVHHDEAAHELVLHELVPSNASDDDVLWKPR